MKKKIIIKVGINCDKCRSKAMKIASTAGGVASIAIEGDDKDKLVVIGEGVDAASLTTTLKKKLCYARLESIEEVKPPKPKEEEKNPTPCQLCYPTQCPCSCQPPLCYPAQCPPVTLCEPPLWPQFDYYNYKWHY